MNNVNKKWYGLKILKDETDDILKLVTPREIKSLFIKVFELKKSED